MCARLRAHTGRLADPAQAAKAALRSLGRRIAQLGAEADEPERELDRLVAAAAPATMSRLGLGTHHTATLLVAADDNIDRLGTEASFAHLCAAAPVPASSGRTHRRRLNFAGNRAANRALHMIVLVRPRYCERTRHCLDSRVSEGKTKKEAIRCLKSCIAREIYAPCEPTSPPSKPALDIYRNVPVRIMLRQLERGPFGAVVRERRCRGGWRGRPFGRRRPGFVVRFFRVVGVLLIASRVGRALPVGLVAVSVIAAATVIVGRVVRLAVVDCHHTQEVAIDRRELPPLSAATLSGLFSASACHPTAIR